MFREGRILTLLPFENGNGAAMSSSPWEEALGKGDEDVATPVHAGQDPAVDVPRVGPVDGVAFRSEVVTIVPDLHG